MHVVEDLILCMAVPSAGDACNLQIEQAKCIRWEQLRAFRKSAIPFHPPQ